MLAFYSDYPCSASRQTPPCTGILQDIHVQSPLTQLPTPPPSPITWTQQDEGLGRCSHIPNSIFKSFPCSLLCWWQDLWMQHSQLGFFPHFSSFELCHSLPVPGKMCLWQQHFPNDIFQRLGKSSAVTQQRVAGSSSPSRQLLFPKIARQDYQSIINAQVGITDPKSQPGSQPSPTWDVPIPSNSNNKASVFLQDICHLLIRCQENMEFWESKAPELIPALHSKCLSRGFQKDGMFQKGQGGKFSSLWKTR